jgi:hypothetical protein
MSDRGRSPSSGTVRCEQVVLGWSVNSLLGGDGFGPVFASAGWPLPPGDRDAGLGRWARFLDQGAATLVAEGAVPPRCLAYAVTEHGSVLLSKAYAAGATRPGQYVVHALLDPSGRLGPRDLFAAADRGLLRTEQPAGDARPDWPAVAVPLADPAAPGALDAAATAVLAMLLGGLAGRRPVVLASRDAERAEQAVRSAVAVLPPGLTAGLTLTTFATDPAGEGFRLGVAVPPFSRPVAVDLDLDAPLPSPDRATATLVAALTTDGPRDGLGQVTTVAELDSWAALRAGRLGELEPADVQRLLVGPLWRTFLERLDETGPTRLLLEALRDPQLRPVLATRLATPDAGLAQILARAVGRPTGLELRGQGQLQAELVDLLGAAAFARSVLPAVHRLAKADGPLAIAAPALADLVATSLGRRGSAPVGAFDWYADTSTWSVVTDQRLVDWLDGKGPPDPALVDAVAREPAGFAAALDQLVADGRPAKALLTRMHDWPDDGLEVLVLGLLPTRRTPRLFLLDVLGARDPEVARPQLRRHWSEITRQAELGATLTGLLEVVDDQKRPRWPWART